MATQTLDPDRALPAAWECMRIDQTRRRTWSGACRGLAARVRVDGGDLSAGLHLFSDVLRQFEWNGELVQFSFQLANIADCLAVVDPALAVQIGAIVESHAIAPFAAFDAPGFERLVDAANDLGSVVLTTARNHAATLSYDDAVRFVFDAIDQIADSADQI